VCGGGGGGAKSVEQTRARGRVWCVHGGESLGPDFGLRSHGGGQCGCVCAEGEAEAVSPSQDLKKPAVFLSTIPNKKYLQSVWVPVLFGEKLIFWAPSYEVTSRVSQSTPAPSTARVFARAPAGRCLQDGGDVPLQRAKIAQNMHCGRNQDSVPPAGESLTALVVSHHFSEISLLFPPISRWRVEDPSCPSQYQHSPARPIEYRM